jgi:peptidoglycan/LPS O-acetylase OafA/YrhL
MLGLFQLDVSRSSRRLTADYFPTFDYLRIFAAVGVYYSHALLGSSSLPEHFGVACVQLFFALSGFLIGGILVAPGLSLQRFYFNRATRIWIPYFIALGLVAVVSAARQTASDPKLWEFIFYKATFVYNFFGVPQSVEFADQMPLFGSAAHFWSISVEEQFYLLAPLFVVLLSRTALAIALATVIAAHAVVPHDFEAISLGVLLALSRERFGEWYIRYRYAVIAAAASAFALLIAGFATFSTTAPVIAVSLVGISAVRGKQNSIGRILGGASYPFYLNHWIGLWAIKPIMSLANLSHTVAALLACGYTLALSIMHFRLIDAKISRHRSDWFSNRIGAGLCAAGFGLVSIGLIVGFLLKAPFVSHAIP